MILVGEVQLGRAEQYIYTVDEFNNYNKVATGEMDSLGSA